MFSRHKLGHGIHSPFVFDLVSRVFRNKIATDIVFNIEKIRRNLIADRRLIEVNDLGVGSKRMKTDLRKVSDIARFSSVPKKYGILLSNMSAAFGNSLIIEFGTSFGISTMYMAAGCPDASVITMEGCKVVSEIASANFIKAGLTNIKLMSGSFDKLIPVIKNQRKSPGLVFIDGDHRKEAVVRYFNQVADISDNKTVIIIDDINYSREMSDAWGEIKNNEKVSITIDLLRMGLIFFREGLTHFDYVIRY
jgi:predicted O-methyltransferase YrrM